MRLGKHNIKSYRPIAVKSAIYRIEIQIEKEDWPDGQDIKV